MNRFDLKNTDRKLGSKLKAGDRDAYKELFMTHYAPLYFYARKFIQEEESVKDILQDVFTYIWEKHQQIHFEGAVSDYLFRAVKNACINQLRKYQSEEKHLDQFKLKLIRKNEIAPDIIQELQAKELQEEIKNTIESLPEERKKIFKLSRFEGLSYKEIARHLSVSVRTVEVQIYRSLKELRKKMKKN